MEEETEHDRLYKEAIALLRPLIEIHGRKNPKLDAAARDELQRGIDLLNQVVSINPQNWAAMWFEGKAHHRLGNIELAYSFFSRAHGVKPDQPDVAREAAIAAMDLRRPSDAIIFCERAIEAKPQDPGLRANLALALLFNGHAEKARIIAEDALGRNPSDPITIRIVKVCEEVCAGKRDCPQHVRDMG
jgi:Flp pilus assembly protein TadD